MTIHDSLEFKERKNNKGNTIDERIITRNNNREIVLKKSYSRVISLAINKDN
jgi:hypothetical protein